MKKLILTAVLVSLFLLSCKKNDDPSPSNTKSGTDIPGMSQKDMDFINTPDYFVITYDGVEYDSRKYGTSDITYSSNGVFRFELNQNTYLEFSLNMNNYGNKQERINDLKNVVLNKKYYINSNEIDFKKPFPINYKHNINGINFYLDYRKPILIESIVDFDTTKYYNRLNKYLFIETGTKLFEQRFVFESEIKTQTKTYDGEKYIYKDLIINYKFNFDVY